MIIDPTINLGHIITATIAFIGAISAIFIMKADVKLLGAGHADLKSDINELKMSTRTDMNKVESRMGQLTDILIIQAKQDIRIATLETFLLSAATRIRNSELEKRT